MNKTVAWVAPDIHEWTGPKGSVYYVNVKFKDGDSGSIGSRDRHTAQERRALLEAITGTEMDFELDRPKKREDGSTRWNVKDWRAPGEVVAKESYGLHPQDKAHIKHSRDEGMAWGNALNVAVTAIQHGLNIVDVIDAAHVIYAARPDTSAPAPPPSPSAAAPTVAGADPTSSVDVAAAESPAARRPGSAEDPTSVPDGEAGADTQGEGDPADGVDTPSSCTHEWTSLRPDGEPYRGGLQRCTECGATRRRT